MGSEGADCMVAASLRYVCHPYGDPHFPLGTATTTPQFQQLTIRTEFFIFEAFCSQRIAKMFDILIDFPQRCIILHDLVSLTES